GQFLSVRFLNKSMWWEAHPFSISGIFDNSLRISPKNVGDFTSKLGSLKKGTKILIEGPFGSFTQNLSTTNKILFIAGGIGITPIRSLIESFGKSNKQMVLLYSNKTEREIVFKNELQNLAKKTNLKIIYVISEDEKFKGEKGRIDKEKLERLVKDIKER